MTEVSVIFPSRGGIDVQHRETIEQTQEINWRVQSFNPKVSKVRIAFVDKKNKFFGKGGKASNASVWKGLSYSQQYATATIYGRAPKKVAGAAKYTVTGFVKGKNIELDPEIVINPSTGGG